MWGQLQGSFVTLFFFKKKLCFRFTFWGYDYSACMCVLSGEIVSSLNWHHQWLWATMWVLDKSRSSARASVLTSELSLQAASFVMQGTCRCRLCYRGKNCPTDGDAPCKVVLFERLWVLLDYSNGICQGWCVKNLTCVWETGPLTSKGLCGSAKFPWNKFSCCS